MTATGTAERAPERAAGGRTPLTPRQLVVRGALLLAIVLLVVMWIYAFVFADDSAVAKVQDRSWTKRAAQICDRRNDLLDLNAKNIRATTDGSPQAVGLGVSRATDIIEAALDEVLAVQPPSIEDRELISTWESMYRTYIADRRATEAKLANGEEAELNETTLNGSPISATIGDFTKPNLMDSCAVPTGS